jgi:hypothetical protein
MILLSIDVGIINLGICLFDTTSRKILKWETEGVPPESDKGLYQSLYEHFKCRQWVLTADKVLIEKQPDKNKKMKSVEHFITAYFICNEKDVQVYDARHKIPDVVGPGKEMYRKRKNMSITRCREFLEQNNTEWIQYFNKHKKKDDLADTVMQAISYHDKPSDATSNKRPVARKPTLHQKNTKYSKSNLAWLYKNNMTDGRFEKDLRKYYSNVEQLKTEFNI